MLCLACASSTWLWLLTHFLVFVQLFLLIEGWGMWKRRGHVFVGRHPGAQQSLLETLDHLSLLLYLPYSYAAIISGELLQTPIGAYSVFCSCPISASVFA